MSRRGSRPSSAASQSSRAYESELRQECKAAYLCVFDDLKDRIKSKDGLIAVLQLTGRNPTKKSLSTHWPNDTRYLTFDDFVQICKKEYVTTSDDLMKAFKKIDLNGDGYISADELLRLMTTRGERMSKDDVRKLIDEVDENGDGRLDYKEDRKFYYSQFCNMMVTTADDCKRLTMKIMEKKERRKQYADDGRSSRRESQLKSISQVSLRSNLSSKSDKASMAGSRQSLLNIDDLPRPVPRSRRDSRASVASRVSKLPEPKDLGDWSHLHSKGCFFLDQEEGIISHTFELNLRQSSNVWITIHPLKISDTGPDSQFPIDTALYIVKNNKLVTFTEQRDSKGKYCVRCDLDEGKYTILPFTTGCRLKASNKPVRQEAKLVKMDKDDKVVITKGFRRALGEAFEMSDLDGNNMLNREEFNLFTLRSSGDEVADDEWAIVEENVEMIDGEITKKGFIRLNEMEAEDNGGEEEDLWVTLTSFGFNKNLELDEACAYKIDVYVEESESVFRPTGIEPLSNRLDHIICDSVLAKGESSPSQDKRDVLLHTYIGDTRATIVAENKGYSTTKVNVDCGGSRNCSSNTDSLDNMVTVEGHSAKVVLHLMPEDERSEWCVKCE